MLWMIDLVLAVASAGVLVGLLYIYGSNFRSVRSPLSVGLIVFAALFLVGNVAAMLFYLSLNDRLSGTGFGADVAMPMLVLNVLELAGFATLFYVSWR